MYISFGLDAASLAKLEKLRIAAPEKVRRVLPRALNRGAEAARTIAKRVISRTLGIPAAALTRPHRFGARRGSREGTALEVLPATPENAEAHLYITGSRIPLIYFRAREMTTAARRFARVLIKGNWRTIRVRSRGVRWQLKGAKKEKWAFIATMRSGHKGVFVRRFVKTADVQSRDKGKIRELLGPSIPHVAEQSGELDAAWRADVRDTVSRRIAHEVDRILGEE